MSGLDTSPGCSRFLSYECTRSDALFFPRTCVHGVPACETLKNDLKELVGLSDTTDLRSEPKA